MCALVIERSFWIVHEILLEAPTAATVDVSLYSGRNNEAGREGSAEDCPLRLRCWRPAYPPKEPPKVFAISEIGVGIQGLGHWVLIELHRGQGYVFEKGVEEIENQKSRAHPNFITPKHSEVSAMHAPHQRPSRLS